jgi:tuftelin-interacting protein 11
MMCAATNNQRRLIVRLWWRKNEDQPTLKPAYTAMADRDEEEEEGDDDWRAIDSGSSDDEEANNPLDRRKRRKHEATYGVFWEEEDDGPKKKRPRSLRLRNNDPSSRGGSSGELQFVRSTKPDDDAGHDNKQDEDNSPKLPLDEEPRNATKQDNSNKNDGDAEEDYDEEDQKRKMKANEHFLALLAKSRDKKAQQRTTFSTAVDHSEGQQILPPVVPPSNRNDGHIGTSMEFSHPSADEEAGYQGPVGLGFAKTRQSDVAARVNDDDMMPRAGLGFGKQAKRGNDNDSETVPDSFGRRFRAPKVVKPDPNIGKWEQYEKKGIGSKLLAKMGYKGSGGLQADSIAQPIAVKLRPANLGLGFGNFKEVSSKKVPAKPMATNEPESSAAYSSVGRASALPSATDILRQTAGRRRKANKASATFVPYSEILSRSKETAGSSMQIIDMTGGPAATRDTNEDGSVALGDELLYNVSFLLNTYENRLQSASNFEQSYRRQYESFKADLASLQEKANLLREREEKLVKVQHLLKDLEAVLDTDTFEVQWRGAQSRIEQLAGLFSEQETKDLRFFETLVPSVLGQIADRELDAWQPASSTPRETTVRLILLQDKDGEMWHSARKVLFANHVLPKLQQRFFSSRWNPMDEQHNRIEMVELLRRILREAIDMESRMSQDDHDPATILHVEKELKRTELLELFQSELVDGTINEKLLSSIQRWKPVDGKRLDLWILPWLPLLSKGNVPVLVAEAKRQLRVDVSFLNKTIGDNEDFVVRALATMGPWKGVLKARSRQQITKELVTPRLARLLARYPFKADSNDDSIVNLPLQMHFRGLIDDRTLLSLLEGELLPNMAKCSARWTKADMAKRYCRWKTLLFTSQVQELLRVDDGVCRSLYAILLAEPFAPTNVMVVLARRKLQAQEKNDEEWIRQEDTSETVEARVRLGNKTATFREVVEEIARAHDLLLIPHRNKRVDGKQVFLLGKIPVYFDGNVAYSSINGGNWEATSVQDIADAALLLGN